MNIIIKLLINALAVIIAAYLLPGIEVDGFLAAVVVAVVLGIINAFIKPVVILLTLPLHLLTLGLFTLVVNALLIMLAGIVVPGFIVAGFWWALLFSIVLSVVSAVLNRLNK
jgi:putative membrane protein